MRGRLIYAVTLGLVVVAAALVWRGTGRLPHFTDSWKLALYLRSFGVWTAGASIFLMILQTIFTPLPLFLVAGAIGFIFGVVKGTLITMTGAMAGASVAFYLARFFRAGFRRLDTGRLAGLDPKNEARLVFLARLVPLIPSSVVSYAAGLSRMRFSSFFLVSVLGNLPETVLYTFLGQSVARARLLDLWISLAVLLITGAYFSLAAKKHLAGFFAGPKN